MQGHDRATVRLQRERYMKKRRAQFAGWLGTIDYAAGHHINEHGRAPNNAPRPLEVRVAEFWDGRRVGLLSKWNGVCSCWMCRGRKSWQDRARLKAEVRQMLEAV